MSHWADKDGAGGQAQGEAQQMLMVPSALWRGPCKRGDAQDKLGALGWIND